MQYFENGKWVKGVKIDKEFIDKLEKVASKAEGPAWKHEIGEDGKHYINTSGTRVAEIVFYENENAEFIGMANKGIVLGMIQRIRELEREVSVLKSKSPSTRRKITICVECDNDGIQDVGWDSEELK